MFQIDDDWGSTAKIDYPKLPAKENASKTVQKRRKKAAKKVLDMSSTAVLPGEARLSLVRDLLFGQVKKVLHSLIVAKVLHICQRIAGIDLTTVYCHLRATSC